MATIDLNADLGEGQGTDEQMVPLVSSTSIACGGHAGDVGTMAAVSALAAHHGVVVGAHPSYPDREGFGRREWDGPLDGLLSSLRSQVATLVGLAPVRFLKAHGALYNRAATDPALAEVVVAVASEFGLPLLGPGRSEMARQAGRSGVTFRAEAFADRAYTPDGHLVPRTAPGAVLTSPGEVADRAVALARSGRVTDVEGRWLAVAADSICLHGDTPGAVGLAVAVRRALEEAGVGIRPFC